MMRIKKSIAFIFIGVMIFIIILFALLKDAFLAGYCSILLISASVFFVVGKSDLLAPLNLFFLMYLFFIGLGPLAYYYYTSSYNKDDCIIIILSFSLFLIGYFLTRNIGKKRKIDSRKTLLRFGNEASIEVLCNVLLVIALICKTIYLLKNRNLLLLGSLDENRIAASSGNGVLIYLGNTWSIATLILVEMRIRGRKINKISIFLGIMCLLLQLTSGFRTGIITFILSIILMMNKKKKIPNRHIAIAGGVLIAFMGIYAGIRSGLSLNGNFWKTFTDTFIKESYVGLINYHYMLNSFPSKHSFFYGYGYLINFIMLAPGPDLDFTLTLKQIVGLTYSGGGLTPTILGEFYANFGYSGILIGMLLFGIIYGKIARYALLSKSYFFPTLLIVNCLLAIRGGFSNQEISLVISLIVYRTICYFSNYQIHVFFKGVKVIPRGTLHD